MVGTLSCRFSRVPQSMFWSKNKKYTPIKMNKELKGNMFMQLIASFNYMNMH